MSPEDKRKSLHSFLAQEISVDELAIRHPDCACEHAASEDGSPGPVANDERLRLFLTSRSDIDAKKTNQLQNRTFRATSLQKAYTNGLSTYRVAHATKDELEYSAKILYDGKIVDDPEYGGILGVMDFPASAVRICPVGHSPMCVLETPLDPSSDNTFLRPSHCDVVNSQPIADQEDRVAARRVIFNQINEQGQKTNAEDVKDCDLVQFLPAITKRTS